MIDLATLARTFDAVFLACQPEPDARHDDVTIDEFENDENCTADMRQRVKDAQDGGRS